MEGCEGNHELPELRGRQGEFVGNHGNSTWLKKKKKKKRVPERKVLHRERTREIHKDLFLSI